jgi:hypothetical protein
MSTYNVTVAPTSTAPARQSAKPLGDDPAHNVTPARRFVVVLDPRPARGLTRGRVIDERQHDVAGLARRGVKLVELSPDEDELAVLLEVAK